MNSVANSAVLYNQVHVIRSSVADHAVVADNTDLIDSLVGPHAQVGRRNLVIGSEIGEGTYTGSNDVIFGASIGKYCCVSWNVGIGGGNHDYKAANMFTNHNWKKILGVDFPPDRTGSGGGVVLRNGVWIAQGVSVVSGVTIGDGAVIGAGATVLSDIPPFAIAVGTPARVIKYRFDVETIRRLLDIAWWDWDREAIRESASLLRRGVDEETLCELEKRRPEGVVANDG